MNKKAHGFTIVELLVVIVVIGILAAVAIVSYGGIQKRAKTVARESETSEILKATEIYNAMEGTYPKFLMSEGRLQAAGLSVLDLPTSMTDRMVVCGWAEGPIVHSTCTNAVTQDNYVIFTMSLDAAGYNQIPDGEMTLGTSFGIAYFDEQKPGWRATFSFGNNNGHEGLGDWGFLHTGWSEPASTCIDFSTCTSPTLYD